MTFASVHCSRRALVSVEESPLLLELSHGELSPTFRYRHLRARSESCPFKKSGPNSDVRRLFKMKISWTRGNVLNAVVVAILLAALPGALRRIIETGDLYLFSRHFLEDMLARLSGPGRLRFILQPAAAIFLGGRDGIKDAHAGNAPFLWTLLRRSQGWREQLAYAFDSTRGLVSAAILLDVISQFLIFREIHPGAALIVGPVLIALPYAVARALANRFSKGRGP